MKRIDADIEQMVSSLQQLWGELFPDFAPEEAPYQSRLQEWLQTGGMAVCEYAVRRAWRKRFNANRKGNPMTAGQVRRYAEIVIEHEMAGDREQSFVREWGTDRKAEEPQ